MIEELLDDAKRRMDELVGNLMTAYAQGIDGLEWMSPATKEKEGRWTAGKGTKSDDGAIVYELPGAVSLSTRPGCVTNIAAAKQNGIVTSQGRVNDSGAPPPQPTAVNAAAAHAPIPKAT